MGGEVSGRVPLAGSVGMLQIAAGQRPRWLRISVIHVLQRHLLLLLQSLLLIVHLLLEGAGGWDAVETLDL